MSRRRLGLIMAAGLLVVLPAGSRPALAQQSPPSPKKAKSGAKQPAEAAKESVLPSGNVDVSKIDQILRGEEKVFEGQKFSYDPAGRRDPFVSLTRGLQEERKTKERPPGLAGMAIDELTLEGIIETSSGTIAIAQGRDKLSYILRPGTKLYDGEVKKIERHKIIFEQQVNDPKALKPTREVVREIAEK
ncbi:MAG TPA: hypothetical protein ENK19_04500 [Acidobacteria bacterium]|nr:hypothetical protein [Acidobacteriota bacterium]